METKQSDKIAAFDTLYTTNRIQMLKILFPLVGKKNRHKLAIYIKYLELQYTLALTKEGPFSFSLCSGGDEESKEFDLGGLCDELAPFCNEKEKAMLKQFKNIQNTLNQVKEMEAAMSMMKELFPEADNDNTEENNSPFSMEMLMSMLSPQQQEMFSMFQNKEE